MDRADALRILDEERRRAMELIAQAGTLEALESARTSSLGRKAPFSQVQRALGDMSDADRPAVGQAANETRAALEAALDERRVALEREAE